MQDGIIAETGNSRYLRSIAGFLQAYPTYCMHCLRWTRHMGSS